MSTAIKNPRVAFLWTLCASLLIPAVSVRAVERHVPGEYATIQPAIDAAVDGDEIIISPGTYTGDGNRDIDFKGKAITVRSTNPDDPAIVAATIIDCQGTEAAPHRGFVLRSGEPAASAIRGLTITHGYAPTEQNGTTTGVLGGGILCYGSSPTIAKCVVRDSYAVYGGGMYLRNHASSVTDCTVTGNTAETGGGIRFYESTSEIRNCTISGNTADNGGGAACYDSISLFLNCTLTENRVTTSGGGLAFASGDPTVRNCTIARNQADLTGGGVAFWGTGSPTLVDCIIVGNSSGARSSGGAGGGLFGPATINRCVIVGNSSEYGGGAYGEALMIIDDSTVARNHALMEGGGLCYTRLGPTIADSAIVANSASYGGGIALQHCNVPAGSIMRSRIVGNSANLGGGIRCNGGVTGMASCVVAGNYGGALSGWGGTITVANCILSEDSPDEGGTSCSGSSMTITNCILRSLLFVAETGVLSVRYSNVYGGAASASVEAGATLNWGAGNLDAAPLFVDSVSRDYHLAWGSPCIDAGNNADVDAGAETDMDGDARIIDGDGSGSSVVDIGGDEYRPALQANPRPTPDPLVLEYAGAQRLNGVLTLCLRARQAVIPGQPDAAVEYFFESPAGNVILPTSGWQSSRVFNAGPVSPGQWCSYRVKARNAANPTAETSWSPIEPILAAAGDFDADGDMDLIDFSRFQGCFNGPNRPPARSECLDTDLDNDGDVDLSDFAAFQACFNGPNRSPACH